MQAWQCDLVDEIHRGAPVEGGDVQIEIVEVESCGKKCFRLIVR
jgi:hypothetical protein